MQMLIDMITVSSNCNVPALSGMLFLTNLLTNLLTYLLTYLLIYTYLLTYLLTYLPIRYEKEYNVC